MSWSLVFKPVIPMPALLGLAAVALLAVVGGYALGAKGTGRWRRSILTLLRLVVLGILLLILARPMVLQPAELVSDRPVFAILMDTSQSMNTVDVGGQSRFDAAVSALTGSQGRSFLADLSRRFRVQLYGFDEGVRRLSVRELSSQARAEGRDTRIAAALMEVGEGRAGRAPKGILLISDGRSNEFQGQAEVYQAARYLRTHKVPVWTMPLGSDTDVRDVTLTASLSSNYILADQPASIRVTVASSGYDNWHVKLNLYREEVYVTSAQVELQSGHAEVRFPIREETQGAFQYRVAVEPLPGEADTANNERRLVARIVNEKVKVLVVEAKPHWDSKFLLRALRSDMNVEVTSIFHINRDKTFAVVERISAEDALVKEVVPGVQMPRTKEALYGYDCVILGRHMDDVFTSKDLSLLQDYVIERGGSVVFFRGKPYTLASPQLARLEPVTWGEGAVHDVHFDLTGEGKSHPMFNYAAHASPGDVIVRELPGMTSITRVDDQRSLAVVLAQTEDDRNGQPMATVAYHRYGKGKVMSIGAAGLWQWGFLPESLQAYDDIHTRFWSQMIRWLISDSEFLPGQDISFVVDRHTYEPGEMVRLALNAKLVDRARFRPRIELTDPTGEKTVLIPERQGESDTLYAAYYLPEHEGQYEAVLFDNTGRPETDRVRFTVYDDSLEARYVQSDRGLLAQLARTTGGESLTLEDLPELPARIKAFEQLFRAELRPQDVWDRGSVFGLLVALLGCEWLIRRLSGMV